MGKPEPVIVAPVPGHYVTGIPTTPIATDAATAARLVATGAFAPAPRLTEAAPLTEAATAVLDVHVPKE